MKRCARYTLVALLLCGCAPMPAFAQSACLGDAARAALQARFDAVAEHLWANDAEALDAEFAAAEEALTVDNRCRLEENDRAFLALGAEMQAENFRLEMQVCERAWRHTPIWTKWRRYHGHDPCRGAVRATAQGGQQ